MMAKEGWDVRIKQVAWSIVCRRCPQCGLGSPFTGWFRMKPACEECGRKFQGPSGSTTGTMQVGSMAVVFFAIFIWFVLYNGFGLERDPALIGMSLASVVFGAFFHPYAKLIWEGVDTLIDEMNQGNDTQE